MARDMLEGVRLKSTTFVLMVLMLSSVPMVPSVSADQGIPAELQAQGIAASFDNLSETTTITWRNIDQTGNNADLYSDLWDTTYHIYRHSSPITPANIDSLSSWHSVVACDKDVLGGNPLTCRGIQGNSPHPGHSATMQVGAGNNGTFFYAITSELPNGNITTPLDWNASNLFEPVLEITSPVRSPYNIQASFSPGTSQTTVQWINYNSINPILPEDGVDALDIHIWRTEYEVNRANGMDLITSVEDTPVAVLPATTTQHTFDIPPLTNREVYYSVTYLLPNWTASGGDYEDGRFLSNNAMTTPVLEDNSPPEDVSFVSVSFVEDPMEGSGNTTITWMDVPGEVGESYRIYISGVMFNNTSSNGVNLMATVAENQHSYTYQVPIGRLGYSYYCVVVQDQFGAYSTFVPWSSCDIVFEDAFNHWVAEPTNVNAVFLGDGVTRVTWVDQLGAEGEKYHIWKSSYRVTGNEFVENTTLDWLGTVPDGVQQFDAMLDDDISTASFYFVTSEALYGHVNGTYHYTKLDQNWVGPIEEDTTPPDAARISDATMVGQLSIVTLTWLNAAGEDGESYTIYRHIGDPFGENEFATSNYSDAGWEFVTGPIYDWETSLSTLAREIPVVNDTQRDVWYSIIMADSYGNINPLIFPGIGGNAIQVAEDTRAPTMELAITNDDGLVESAALVKGDYTIRVAVSENLLSFPQINVTTTGGASYSDGTVQMNLLSDNLNDDSKGPEFYFPLEITSTSNAGDLVIEITLTDISENSITYFISEKSIDAKAPTITIYSPSAMSDGSKYLYNNKITVTAGASDDVGIISMQMRFVQNYGTSNSISEPWREVSGLNVAANGDWTFEMDFNAANFLPGIHQVSVRGEDAAGNARETNVKFVVDWCRHREDGSTVCEYSNPVDMDPDPIVMTYNVSDPPFIITWITAGVSLLAVIVSLMVISTSMKGPKKRGDDEDVNEDWMSEFIGTSSEPDMEAITGGKPPEEKKEDKTPEPVDDEDDPFAVNVVQRRERRKKKPKDDDDDDDDDDDEEDDKNSKRKKGKRKGKRRSAKRKKD